MGLELDTETSPPVTEPSNAIVISFSDLNFIKDAKLQAALALKDAQLAEMQKQNLLLKIYLKYGLSGLAEINEETGEVFYPKK